MDKIKLKIYNADFTAVEREVKAKLTVIPFGTIRKLMGLFETENIDDTRAIASVILKSWNSIIKVLDRVFEDVSEDEWDRVDTKDLIVCVVELIKFATSTLLTIPTEKN